MIKSLGNIAGHLDVLDLVSPDRHAMRIEDQDVRRHQNRIGEEPHRRSKIGILTRCLIRLHGCLVRMSTIHQAFRRRAAQYPAQLGDFWEYQTGGKRSCGPDPNRVPATSPQFPGLIVRPRLDFDS